MIHTSTFTALFLVLVPILAFSHSRLEPGLSVDILHYDTNDGLSNNDVNAIVPDKRGILWIATRYGLNEFDGKNFRVFAAQQGLAYNSIGHLFYDGKRSLFLIYMEVGSETDHIKGIEVFDIYTHSLTPIQQFLEPHGIEVGTPARAVVTTEFLQIENQEGKHFLITKGNAVYQFDLLLSETVVAIDSTSQCIWSTLQKKDTCHLIKRDFSGRFKDSKLISAGVYDIFAFIHLVEGQRLVFALRKKNCQQLVELTRFDYDLNIVSTHTLFLKSIMAKGAYNIAYLPAYDAYWAAASNWGRLYTPAGDVRLELEQLNAPIGSKRLQNFYRKNTIWQCSQSGFLKITINENKFQHILEGEPKVVGYRAISKLDSLYFFSWAHGVKVMKNPRSNKVIDEVGRGLAATVKNGRLWTGNFKEIFSYHPATSTLDSFDIEAVNEPWSMFLDENDVLWMSHNGVLGYDIQHKTIIEPTYRTCGRQKDFIVYFMYEKNPDTLLLCSSQGLFVLDVKKRIVRCFDPAVHQLPAFSYRHFYYDEKDNIYWLATGGNGLVRWDINKKTYQQFKFGQGASNILHCVYTDDYGHLWMSSDNGLIQFDTTAHRYRIYSQKDGLAVNEFNRLSHFKDEDGTLFMGTINGVTILHPQDFKDAFSQEYEVQPQIVDITLNQSSEPDSRSLFDEYRSKGKLIIWPGEQYLLRLCLDEPVLNTKETTFFYRLAGKSGDWYQVNDNILHLGQLPYGHQVVQVKARLGNGQYAESILNIPVLQKKPIHLRWWFTSALISFIVLIFYAAYRYKLLQLEQRQQIRTKIASDLHDDVGAKLSRLGMQAEMLQYVSDEKKEAVAKDIIDTSRQSLLIMKDIIWSIDARNDSYYDLIEKMELHLEETLSPIGMHYQIDHEGTDPEALVDFEVRHNLFMIFKEAVNNTIRHSNASGIHLFYKQGQFGFLLSIKEVFDQEKPRNMKLKKFYNPKGGQGLKNMKLRAQRIGAHLDIKTDQGYWVAVKKEKPLKFFKKW